MKKILLSIATLLILILFSINTHAQVTVNIPAQGTGNLQDACEGTLYDSGGPDASIGSFDNGIITIKPLGANTITIQFLEWDLGDASGNFTIYEGETTNGFLLAQYFDAFTVPNDGDPLVLNTGAITIQFNSFSDFALPGPGFAMTWKANGGNNPVTANFTLSDLNPPSNAPVQLFDASSSNSSSWLWDFGDGSTSTEQFPQHNFSQSGNYTITLTVSNCYGESDSFSQEITVQQDAGISVTPASFNVSLAYGDSTFQTLNIKNTGVGDLVYNIDGISLQSQKKLQLTTIKGYSHITQEYARTLLALSANYTDYNLTELDQPTVAQLESALKNTDVLLIPEQENCPSGDNAFTTYASVLHNFVEQGGYVILLGAENSNCLFGTDLFHGTYNDDIYLEDLDVVAPNDPLAEGIDPEFTCLVATYTYQLTDPDLVHVVTYNNNIDVVAYRNIGAGRAILIGFDYFASNENMKKILANAVKSGEKTSVKWLYASSKSDTLQQNENQTIVLEFNATNVYGGIYHFDLHVTSNDPNNPDIIIPCTLTVTGQAAIDLSPMIFDFGMVMTGAINTKTVLISNPGSDSLFVDLASNNPVFTASENHFALYGGTTKEITLTFTPTEIANYTGEIAVNTNVANFSLSLTGIGVGAPVTTITPPAINVTLFTDETTSIPVNISNSGQGPLIYSANTPFLANTPSILLFTKGVYEWDLGTLKTTIQNAIPNMVIYETDTNNPQELEQLLKNVPVFLIPYIDTWTYPEIPNYFSDFHEVLNTYIQNGGHVVFTQNYEQQPGNTPMLKSGFFTGTSTFSNTNLLTPTIENHPIVKNVDFSLPNFNFSPYNFTNPVTNILENDLNASVIAYNAIGKGKAIYFGFNPGSGDLLVSTLLTNTVNWCEANSLIYWMEYEHDGANIGFPSDTTFDVSFDATDMLGGVYTTTITLITNDPIQSTIEIPVTLTVIGIPEYTISTNSIDFGNVIETQTRTEEVTIKSIGTDDVIISNINISSPAFTTNLTPTNIDPENDLTFTVTFAPTDIAAYTGTITLVTNVGDLIINVTGNGTGIPVGNYTPTSYVGTLLSGNDTTFNINISNPGAGPLEYTISPDVLMYSYSANPQSFEGAVNAVTEALGGFAPQLTNTTDIEEFSYLLNGKSAFIVPHQIYDPSLYNIAAMFYPILQDFVNNGGKLIFLGNDQSAFINNSPLSEGYYYTPFAGSSCNVSMPNDAYASGIENNFIAPQQTFAYYFYGADVQHVIQGDYFGTPVDLMAYKNAGQGTAIFIAFNYETPDANATKALTNALSGAFLPSWLSVTPLSGTVDINGTQTLTVNVDATDMLAGIYHTNLIIKSNAPGNPQQVIPFTLTVLAFPQAIFEANKTFSCDGIVAFSDNSINIPLNWAWDFGDGFTSNEQNPVHEYTNNGTYDVKLIACNDIGCDTTLLSNYLTVDLANKFCDTLTMSNNGTVINSTNCNGVVVDPGGKNNNYPDNVNNSTITIAPPGAVGITLTFTQFNTENCCDRLQIYKGTAVTPQSFLAQYQGNALPNNGTGIVEVPSGSVTLVLYTNGQNNFEGFVMKYECHSIEAAPDAHFNETVTNNCTGTVAFDDISTNFPNQWTWDFGDGTTSNEENPSHSYALSGTYNVTLTACNNEFGCNTWSKSIELTNVLGILWDVPNSAKIGTPTQFKDNTPNVISRVWNFGDGGTAINQASLFHTYSALGTYNVQLTVVNNQNCQRTISKQILVDETGINILDPENSFTVLPNPTNGAIKIAYVPNSGLHNIVLKIMDITGKEVYSEEKLMIQEYQKSLDLSAYPQGMYVFMLQSDDNIMIKKVQKN